MLLASCVNTPLDHNVFHNLRARACCNVLRVLCELGLRELHFGDLTRQQRVAWFLTAVPRDSSMNDVTPTV